MFGSAKLSLLKNLSGVYIYQCTAAQVFFMGDTRRFITVVHTVNLKRFCCI